MATYTRVHPFPSIACPTLVDKVLELFLQTFVAKLVLGFIRGSGADRLVNAGHGDLLPGQAVYMFANSSVAPALDILGAVGVVNSLNPVPVGAYVDIKSVGEYDVPVVAPGAAFGDCLWIDSAVPGSFTATPNLLAACAKVVDASAYAATGKCKVQLLLPTCELAL